MTDKEIEEAYHSYLENESEALKPCEDGGLQFTKEGDKLSVELNTLQKKLQKMYLSYLAEEGFRAKLDSDGDVSFKYEGGSYFIDTNTGNNENGLCFQIVYPAFWEIESSEEHSRALAAASEVNRIMKIGKVYITANNTWGRVSLLLHSPEQFKEFFERTLQALQSCTKMFCQEMHKDDSESP